MEITQTINCTDNDWSSANDELCRCDACVKARAEFNDWCNAFEERHPPRNVELTAPSGLLTEAVR